MGARDGDEARPGAPVPTHLRVDRAGSPELTALGDPAAWSGSRGRPWERAAAALLVAACAVVPCVFTTRFEDVFSLPKLVVLWVLFAVLFWLVALTGLGRTAGTRLPFHPVVVVDLPIALFVLWNLLAFVLSSDRHQSLVGEQLQYQGLLTLLLYVAFFYFARILISSPRRVAWLFGAVAIGATAVSGYAIVQALGHDPIWRGQLPSGRVFSTIGQPNALAAYLVLSDPDHGSRSGSGAADFAVSPRSSPLS